jgi:hypothetical protein
MPRRLAVAALLVAGSACAQDCGGSWDGTLGSTPLMLQFNWERLGSYYLGTALSGAVLRPRMSDPQAWDEYDDQGRHTASLRLACSEQEARGERTSAQGQRSAV